MATVSPFCTVKVMSRITSPRPPVCGMKTHQLRYARDKVEAHLRKNWDE
jgi:hypothetical protein